MESNRTADGGTHSHNAAESVGDETTDRSGDAVGAGATKGGFADTLSRRAVLKSGGVALARAVGLHTLTGAGLADDDGIMELDLRDGVPDVTDAP